MTSPSSWYAAAHNWRMRAAETRALADEMKEAEPKAIMLRIAADYEKLAEWAEKNSTPWWDKKQRGTQSATAHTINTIRTPIAT